MIKSGSMHERPSGEPPIIKGKSIISVLNEKNKSFSLGLLFNGALSPRFVLEPRMPYWRHEGKLYPDSKVNVVCVSDDVLISVFMALVPRRGLPFGENSNQKGGIDFYLHPSLQEDFLNSTGYVACLDTKKFEIFDGAMPYGWPGQTQRRRPEMRTANQTVPLFNVEVTFQDFVELLESRPDCRLEYRQPVIA